MDRQTVEMHIRRKKTPDAALEYRSELEQAAKWLIDAILAESGATADSQYLEDLMILQDKIRKIMSQSDLTP